MLTVNYFVKNQLSVSHVLTDADKKALIEENNDKNFSYLCLLKEMLQYKGRTVHDVLTGCGGIQLVKVPPQYKKVKR